MRILPLSTLTDWREHEPSEGVRDERMVMGVTSGVMWASAAVVAGLGQLLPGAAHEHAIWIVTVGSAVFVYGLASIVGLIPWMRFTLRDHAVAVLVLVPVIGIALWGTGGVDSYVQPLLIFPMLYIAYFFPLGMARPLGAWLVVIYASPLLYDDDALAVGYPSRILGFTVAMAFLMIVIFVLKGRLLAAEARQAVMARQDPLTGLANRRAFDGELDLQVARSGVRSDGRRMVDAAPGFALLLLDLDGFKAINDTLGHQAGDLVLREVAARCTSAVRPGDCVARIGGDEFAVLAPGAGADGARRLAAALEEAIASVAVPDGVERLGVTIGSGVFPGDGETADELVHAADRRLYAGKRVDAAVAPS
jgi:diguanylate cyclase (GGDEF)-like protein